MNDMNLNTLFASIIDALATAVAAKIPVPNLNEQFTNYVRNDMAFDALIDAKFAAMVDEKVKANITQPTGGKTEDELHDMIVSEVDEYMHDNRKLQRAIEQQIDDIDWHDKVSDALGNIDLTDYIDVNDALDMSAIDDAINEKIDEIEWGNKFDENIDLDRKVNDALNDIDWSSHIDIDSAVDDRMDATFDERFDERFDEKMKERTDQTQAQSETALRTMMREEIMAVQQSNPLGEEAVRKIIREEMRLMLAQMIESTKQ